MYVKKFDESTARATLSSCVIVISPVSRVVPLRDRTIDELQSYEVEDAKVSIYPYSPCPTVATTDIETLPTRPSGAQDLGEVRSTEST